MNIVAQTFSNFFEKNQKVVSTDELKYPEFGTPIGNPVQYSKFRIANRIALIGLAILGVAVAVAVGSTGIGLAVAGGMLLTYGIYKIAKKIFMHYRGHRYQLAFNPTTKNENAPKLGAYTKTDLRICNHTTESFEWKKELISSAQDSIELSGNFAGGEKLRECLQLMERQMTKHPNLKCHLIFSSDLLEKQDKKYLKKLAKIYPNFHYLITDRIYRLDPVPLSEENHVKLLIVDGKYFAMGGTGIHEKMTREEHINEPNEKESLGASLIDKNFRDTDLILYGEVAQTMRNQFFNLYRIMEYRMTKKEVDRYFENQPEKSGRCELFHNDEGLIKDCNLKYVVSGPEHRNKNPISSEIADLIDKSENEVKIANLIFNPDNIIRESLKKAKARGISIKGYLNGTKEASTSHYLYALPNRHNYNLLTKAYEYRKKNQLYHKKIMTVDNRFAMVSSFNFGIKSAKCDYENACFIDDYRVAKIINQSLKEDAKVSKSYKGDKLISKKKWSLIPSIFAIGVLGHFFG